jgi:trigger factor
MILEDEVESFLKTLASNHATIQDVEVAENGDLVNVELNLDLQGSPKTFAVHFFVGNWYPQRSLEALVGTKTGDTVKTEVTGNSLKLVTKDAKLQLDNDASYPCEIMVNSISRQVTPPIDDEFAKDLEYDNLEQLKEKIAEDMKARVEQKNLQGQNFAVINKLFVDNHFDLPMKTINHLAEDETQKVNDPKYRDYYRYQYRMQIAQEMARMYILNALRKQVGMELTDEMAADYTKHLAILEDKTVEAYQETEKEWLGSENFRESARDYFLLRKVAESCEFTLPEPEPAETDQPNQETEEV